MKNPVDTSKTKLYDYHGDIKKKWSLVYYVYSEGQNKLIRKFDYGINQFDTAKERYLYAPKRILEINKLLKSGYYIKSENKPVKITIKKAFDDVWSFKKQTLKQRSINSIYNVMYDFLDFLRDQKRLYSDIKTLDKFDLINYQDALFKRKNRNNLKLSTRTINNYSGYLVTLVNDIINRYEYITENPFKLVQKFKEKQTLTNRAITQIERKILIPSLQQPQNKTLFLFVGFVFYCWIRPYEVYFIKIKDIDFINKKVFVNAANTKNSKSNFVSIPNEFLQILKEYGLEYQNKDFYIFSPSGVDRLFGLNKYERNTFTELHRALCDKLKLSKEIVLYSWKRTGVEIGARSGMSIYQIKTQGRWSDLKQVDTYLKKTGIDLDVESGADKIRGLK
jgi:integrase